MVIFNFARFLMFVAIGWIITSVMYLINAAFIEKDMPKRIASAIMGFAMIAVLIVCMVL